MDRRRESTCGTTPLTGADAAYVRTQTQEPSVPALIVGATWTAHRRRCCESFSDFGAVYKSTDSTQLIQNAKAVYIKM